VLQPSRAIERKNAPGAVRFAAYVARRMPDRPVRLWIAGPAEDGYADTLARIVERSDVPVTIGRAKHVADAYAACDVVVFPSTWEGFGNPVIESVVARRPLAVHRYPVLDEILTGLRVFSVDDPDEVAAWLRAPDRALLDANREVARRDFSLADLPGRLDAAFASNGWTSW
jgi:mannosylglucosylglycerate synthase